MEEIMNSRDQDHLMQVKIVDTKILGNLMTKEATVKKGKKNHTFKMMNKLFYQKLILFISLLLFRTILLSVTKKRTYAHKLKILM